MCEASFACLIESLCETTCARVLAATQCAQLNYLEGPTEHADPLKNTQKNI
jgi:hypothetical protein